MAITGIVRQQSRSTIVAQNFAPKPNIALAEISDVSTVGVEDGDALVFNSVTNKYEAKTVTATVTEIIGGTF